MLSRFNALLTAASGVAFLAVQLAIEQFRLGLREVVETRREDHAVNTAIARSRRVEIALRITPYDPRALRFLQLVLARLADLRLQCVEGLVELCV